MGETKPHNSGWCCWSLTIKTNHRNEEQKEMPDNMRSTHNTTCGITNATQCK